MLVPALLELVDADGACLEVDVLPGEGTLGGGVAQDLELVGPQTLAPLLLGEGHVSVCLHGLDARPPER